MRVRDMEIGWGGRAKQVDEAIFLLGMRRGSVGRGDIGEEESKDVQRIRDEWMEDELTLRDIGRMGGH